MRQVSRPPRGLLLALLLSLATAAGAQTGPSLRIQGSDTSTSVAPSQLISVTIMNGIAGLPYQLRLRDAAGAYVFSAPANTTVDTDGISITTLVRTPAALGSYHFQLFDGTPLPIATSAAVTVANPLPTITVNGSSEPITVARGARINVRVENGPGNPGDWVGIYPVDPPNAGFILWKYLDNNQSDPPPAQGFRSANLTFNLPFLPGDFEVRLRPYSGPATFAAARVSTSATELPIAVNGAISELELRPGAVVAVSVEGPGNTTDWIGLYRTIGNDHQFLSWRYLNGLMEAPAAGLRQATVGFQLPAEPGVYNFRFFLNNVYTRVASSAPMFVNPAPPAGTISGSDQPDAIPDVTAYQRMFAALQWRMQLAGNATEGLRDAGLDDTQVGLVVNAVDGYAQGRATSSLLVDLRAGLGDAGWNTLQAYCRAQVKPTITIIPGEN